MFGFDPERLYRPSDPELRAIASVGQLSQWRHHNRGPAFIKAETKVFYAGADLIRWLEENRVRTPDQPAAA